MMFRVQAFRRTAAVAVALAMVVTACGDDDEESDGNDSTATVANSAAPTTGATGAVDLDALYEGTFESVPTEGPKPATGKSVWWVSCGMAEPTCSATADAAKEAAGKLGWDFTIGDGKLNQAGGFLEALQQAVAAKPDGIIVHGMACSVISTGIKAAKAEGIIVIGSESSDCDADGGEKLFEPNPYNSNADTYPVFNAEWGRITAEYLAAKAPDAKVITALPNEPLQRLWNEAFLKGLADSCAGCTVLDNVIWTNPDLGPQGPWNAAFQSSLLKNPTASAVYLPVDALTSYSGGSNVVKAGGREMLRVGGTGSTAVLDLIRSGDWDMTTTHASGWMAYGAMDNLNRLFAGEDPVPQGMGTNVVDRDHNLPASGGYEGPDFKADYEKLWGVG